MSTILKALRKSEAERQLGKAPRLGGLPRSDERGPPSTSRERLAIASLAGLGAVLVGYLLWPDAPIPEPQPASQRIAQATLAERSAAASRPVEEPPAESRTQQEQPAQSPEVEPSGMRPEPAPDTERAPPALDANAPAESPPETAPTRDTREPVPETLPEYALLPRYRHLPQARRDKLPPLTLNVLIYAEEPARRFVMINLDRYAEGDRITDGLRVAEIIAKGVVLEDAQGRFVLPRP